MSSQDGRVKCMDLQALALEAIEELKVAVGSRLDSAQIRLCVEDPKWLAADNAYHDLRQIELALIRAKSLTEALRDSLSGNPGVRRPLPASEAAK